MILLISKEVLSKGKNLADKRYWFCSKNKDLAKK
jgi:hypothetical protein